MKLSRRRFSQMAAGVGALGLLSSPISLFAQSLQLPAPTLPERAAMGAQARDFMQRYDVPALSVAIGAGGAILYQDAFGMADREAGEAATPAHRFRIASVSKPITSVAIFSLVEAGRIRLSDRVFGPGAIAGTEYGRPPFHPHIDEITVEHLLTHTCGGWSNAHNGPDGDDPMFVNLQMDQAQLISWTLANRPLDGPPGERYAYSNFGYCVLGRLIEIVTRQTYSAFVRDNVLARCGVTDMAIAHNALGERQPGEVKYYGQGENPYALNIARMDSHGGWIARPADLVQFLMHVDGFAAPPNILKPATIEVMTTASAVNASYAKGWMVNKAANWWHNGTLAGTSTIAVRTHTGFCWAAFCNTRRPNSPLDGDLDKLIWAMAREVKAWTV